MRSHLLSIVLTFLLVSVSLSSCDEKSRSTNSDQIETTNGSSEEEASERADAKTSEAEPEPEIEVPTEVQMPDPAWLTKAKTPSEQNEGDRYHYQDRPEVRLMGGDDVLRIKDALIGDHKLTMQWLDNHNKGNSGKARIYDVNGSMRISGYQEENNDGHLNYLKINGEMWVVDAKTLLFEGSIENRVNYSFDNDLCLRKGFYLFKKSGSRKYYRMQEGRDIFKEGGIPITDYIDIHEAVLD